MNVLIADDEPMTRSLLRRVLTRECGCTVSEVADGLAALSSCGSAAPDLIVTDLRMPVMDGIGLIEALRQVPALAAIPVVMMTAAREQGPVHRAIELGVTDYLLKPLQADRVADRLKAVIDRVTRASDGSGEDDRTPVLVADGNAEFRQFVATTLGTQRTVHQAPSGVAALQLAAETRPGIVLVGGELGLLGPALLMRKLRAAGELAGTRIIAVVPKADTAIPEQADAVVLRTSFPEGLRRQLAAIAGRARKADGVLAAHPSLRALVATAAEQVFGMMLQLEVQHSFEIQPRPVPRMIVASLAIDLPETDRGPHHRAAHRPCLRGEDRRRDAAGRRADGVRRGGRARRGRGRPRHHRRAHQDEPRDRRRPGRDAAADAAGRCRRRSVRGRRGPDAGDGAHRGRRHPVRAAADGGARRASRGASPTQAAPVPAS